jgi:cell division protein ZapA
MPEQMVQIGGKEFLVACQPGEERYLLAAAKALDTEAQTVISQVGRLPEGRMLLMAGLMLADRVAGLEDQLRTAEAELRTLKARPAPEPQRVEVPVIPAAVTDGMAEIAARAEALAEQIEERLRA